MRSLAVLYALADGRATAGSPAHPDWTEATRIYDLNGLRLFLLGRLYGQSRVDRALAAEACRLGPAGFERMAAEAEARAETLAARDVSLARGQHLLRLGRRVWQDPSFSIPEALPEPVALGALAWLAGTGTDEADALALYAGIAAPSWAVARRTRLNPAEVGALVVDLCAAAPPASPPGMIPASSSPLAEAAARMQAHRQVSLFAS
jgi:urease accessory protein UreF